jgi:5-methylcytosine-specific restriction endonuclease McrA
MKRNRPHPTRPAAVTELHVARPQSAGLGQRRVLLLNATYEPLHAISGRRAIVLLLRERAEVLHTETAGAQVHSAGLTLDMPSVIRLRNYVKVPFRSVVPLTRSALMHRDGHRCGYCGGRADTVDHVVPRSRGGAHSWDNCVACCASCNHRKADRLLSEIGWTLATKLTAPNGTQWRLLSTVKDAAAIDPTWTQYLNAGAA